MPDKRRTFWPVWLGTKVQCHVSVFVWPAAWKSYPDITEKWLSLSSATHHFTKISRSLRQPTPRMHPDIQHWNSGRGIFITLCCILHSQVSQSSPSLHPTLLISLNPGTMSHGDCRFAKLLPIRIPFSILCQRDMAWQCPQKIRNLDGCLPLSCAIAFVDQGSHILDSWKPGLKKG